MCDCIWVRDFAYRIKDISHTQGDDRLGFVKPILRDTRQIITGLKYSNSVMLYFDAIVPSESIKKLFVIVSFYDGLNKRCTVLIHRGTLILIKTSTFVTMKIFDFVHF